MRNVNQESPVLTPFSVILPVYDGDNTEFFRRAFESITIDQRLKPNEIVVVRDGPVRAELQRTIDQLANDCAVPTVKVELARNVGLASALNAGLRRASHEIIARADADDISLPTRFEKQIPLMAAGMDLVGSAIIEFESDENVYGITRTQPVSQEDISKNARFYDPFNHPTVVYRKSAVQKVGGYEHLDLMEDYLLFARMIQAGVATSNLAEGLVLYRIGAGAYKRRGGLRLLRSELNLQATLYREGFTTKIQYLRNVAFRGVYRLVPQSIRRLGYRNILLRTGNRPKS